MNSQKSPERRSGRLYLTRKSVQPPLFIRRLISNLNSVHPYTLQTAVDLFRLHHLPSRGNPLHSQPLRHPRRSNLSKSISFIRSLSPATSDSFALIRRRDSIIRWVISREYSRRDGVQIIDKVQWPDGFGKYNSAPTLYRSPTLTYIGRVRLLRNWYAMIIIDSEEYLLFKFVEY